MNQAVERWQSVRQSVAEAEADAGRPDGSVALVAVSKTYDGAAIWPVIEAGQRVFGENRVQEAMGKWPELRDRSPDPLELHLIGPLQSNKVKEAVATFDMIESVDRDKIAATLASEMQKQGRHLPVLVQVNIGNEPQKAGIAPGETAAFVERCVNEYGLDVRGLMCIPPFDDDPVPYFEEMAKLADETGLPVRSMGMSADFAQAIACGATHIRVGSAIFGPRG